MLRIFCVISTRMDIGVLSLDFFNRKTLFKISHGPLKRLLGINSSQPRNLEDEEQLIANKIFPFIVLFLYQLSLGFLINPFDEVPCLDRFLDHVQEEILEVLSA